jgi:hypothetical protein
MPETMPDLSGPALRVRAETPTRSGLRKAEIDAWKPRLGDALERAVSLCGWSLKEFAGAVDRDPRQCARWMDGSERLQLDAVFAVERLRQPFVQALGELADADVQVTIILRRRP